MNAQLITSYSGGYPQFVPMWADDMPAIIGTIAAVESGADTASISGAVLITGTIAAQETGSDTAAIYGGSLSVITGTVVATESGQDTASVLGQLLTSGLIDASEIGADTCAILGIVTDTAPITIAEVGRSVALAKRNYTARL